MQSGGSYIVPPSSGCSFLEMLRVHSASPYGVSMKIVPIIVTSV
jgi:hypothetical protein